ncbi:hypothetical protein HYX18_01710 [Candidatus Woesearchaeota archaeon]|nr:hypothetical protein [Candidatus Woesearchaeota archaeon]
MAQLLTQLEIELPPELNTLTERNLLRFLSWGDESKQIERRICEEFKTGVFSTLPYSDTNRPPERKKDSIKISEDLEFIVTTTPQKKISSYKEVGVEFDNYLKFLLDQYQKQISREGIITIENEPYILVDEIMKKINEDLQNFLIGKEGILQSLGIIKPEDLTKEIPRLIVIVLGRNYSAVTEYNSRTYVDAQKVLIEGERRVSLFERLLYEDACKVIGTDKPKETVEVLFPFENITILYQMISTSRTSYGDIINAFIKEKPEVLKTNSVFGDLVKAQIYKNEEEKNKLQQKGLLDEEFEIYYKPRIRSGDIYIRLNGVIRRLEVYKKKYTIPSFEKNIFIKSTRISS